MKLNAKKVTLNLEGNNETVQEYKNAYIAYKVLHFDSPTLDQPKYEYYVWPQSWGKNPENPRLGFVQTANDKIPLEDLIKMVEDLLNNKDQSKLTKTFSLIKILNSVGLFRWIGKKFKSIFNG